MGSPSRRTSLIVGSFLVVALLTLAAGFATVTATVAHVEASTLVDGEVDRIEPAAEDDRLHVRVAVENPTGAEFRFRSAFVQVFDGESVVADNGGIGFDRTRIPPGERGALTIAVEIDDEADADAVRAAARGGELRAAGRIEGTVVERTFRISIEHADE